jgi:acetylornithine deacetylase/succinyl-diaminopimelate desuccinylase-like protein
VITWAELLDLLAAGPRENGTPELLRTGEALAVHLESAGWSVERFLFTAYPQEIRILGCVVLVLALLYVGLLRARRPVAAVLSLGIAPVLAILIVDGGFPVFGGPGATQQANVVATLSAEAPAQRLVLAAHYDTKTEPFDHLSRTPMQIAGVVIGVLLVAAPWRTARRRDGKRSPLERVAAPAAIGYGALIAWMYAGGLVLPARSHGAIDDGAACAILVRAAEELAENPPARTEVIVALFSGEELGARGSRAWVAERGPELSALPTTVVNLALIGSSGRFLFAQDFSWSGRGRASDSFLDLLDTALVESGGEPALRTPIAGFTDAVAFSDAGIPAVTVLGRESRFLVPPGMHGPGDRVERIRPEVLEMGLRFVLRTVQLFDGFRAP